MKKQTVCENDDVQQLEYDYHQDVASRQPKVRTSSKLVIRSAYSKIEPVVYENKGPDRTEQHHTASCDIHTILERFQRDGTIAHVNRNQGTYGYATSEDLLGAHLMIKRANEQYETLPATIRDQFENVGAFMDYMNSVDGNISPTEIADQLLAGSEKNDVQDVTSGDDGATEEAPPIDPT